MNVKLLKLLKISWILLCMSAITFPSTIINYSIRAIASSFGIITLVYFGKEYGYKIKKNSFTISFMIYLLFATLSTIISLNKLATFLKALELWIDFFIANLILRISAISKDENISPKYFIEKVIQCCLIVISIIWIGYFIKPELFSGISRGIIKKQLGANCLLSSNACGCTAVLIIIWYLVYRK